MPTLLAELERRVLEAKDALACFDGTLLDESGQPDRERLIEFTRLLDDVDGAVVAFNQAWEQEYPGSRTAHQRI